MEATCNFDDYNDGQVCNQQDWRLLRGSPAGFTIENGAGQTGKAGDKALRIEFETEHSTVMAPPELVWMPADTWSLELDFRIGLAAASNSSTNLILGLLIGNNELADMERWVEALGIQPDGTWSWIGGAPNWELDNNLREELFMARPAGGRAESPWFHMAFTSKKLEQRNSFQSELVIRRCEDDEVLLKQVYKTEPDHSKMASCLWSRNSIRFGFCQGSATPEGWVWIDNIKASSISPPEPEQAGTGDGGKGDGYAQIMCKRPFVRFRDGEKILLDEWELKTFASVPQKYQGFKVSQRYFEMTEPLAFEVRSSGRVYILTQRWMAEWLMRQGWKFAGNASIYNTYQDHTNKDCIMILEKHLPVGTYEFTLMKRDPIGIQVLKE